jgi:hypothetical protein
LLWNGEGMELIILGPGRLLIGRDQSMVVEDENMFEKFSGSYAISS